VIQVGVAQNCIPPMALTTAMAVGAEADGFDSLWYPDHLMGWFPKSLWTPESSTLTAVMPSPHLYFDPMVVIGVLGQATSRALLGTAVTDPLRRPPAELARTFITLSHATEGRAVLGIGAGERENTEPYGISYARQVSKLEEALHVIRLLWESDEPVDFAGRFWPLRKAVLDLMPYDGRFPPIWVGAHGPRMLRITGRYADGWIPSLPMSPQDYGARLGVVRAAAEEAGRDPAAIVAAFHTYILPAVDHETAHRMLASPLAGALALVGSSWQWEHSGRTHPLGKNFEGLRDYVPEWYTQEEMRAAVAQYDPEVFHDFLAHGSAEEIVASIEPYIEAGMTHPILANLAPLAGLEYVEPAREIVREVARLLKA
jgi:phthiodiolone/phenolphthiodiolone dimycocerosates ketoreductase